MEAGLKELPLAKLTEIPTESKGEGKYAIIWDCQGNVATFAGYKMILCDFYKEVMNVGAGNQDKDAAMDALRKKVVHAMKG